MKNQVIVHPQHGHGTVLATRHGGFELQVQFDHGQRVRWVRRDQVQAPVSPATTAPAASPRQTAYPCSSARRIIEALRMGIVPEDCVDDFTFGRNAETARIHQWLNDPNESTLLLVGGYGAGKTHLLNYVRSYALQHGFAVGFVEMDAQETPFSKPRRVYSHLVQSLRFRTGAASPAQDFQAFLKTALSSGLLRKHHYFGHLYGQAHEDMLWEWIEARETAIRPWAVKKRFTNLPALYDHSTAANIFCYLLSTLGWTACQPTLGLNGLVLIFDEAETLYARSSYVARERSYNFLEALIATARGDAHLRQAPWQSGFDHSGHAYDIPFLYAVPSGLKLLFAFTAPDDLYSNELSALKPLTLEPLDDAARDAMLAAVCDLYAQAYALVPASVHPNSIRDYVDVDDYPTRLLIKGAVEALDLLRFHAAADPDEVLV
jgi:hypothetical protein